MLCVVEEKGRRCDCYGVPLISLAPSSLGLWARLVLRPLLQPALYSTFTTLLLPHLHFLPSSSPSHELRNRQQTASHQACVHSLPHSLYPAVVVLPEPADALRSISFLAPSRPNLAPSSPRCLLEHLILNVLSCFSSAPSPYPLIELVFCMLLSLSPTHHAFPTMTLSSSLVSPSSSRQHPPHNHVHFVLDKAASTRPSATPLGGLDVDAVTARLQKEFLKRSSTSSPPLASVRCSLTPQIETHVTDRPTMFSFFAG